jgi:hypothetical protein
MSVEQLKVDAIGAAQKYKARYKQTLDPDDLDMFERFMDVYNHLAGFGGASSLEDLSDVLITGVENGQFLSYNSTTGKWENVTADVSGSGGELDIDGGTFLVPGGGFSFDAGTFI